MLRIIATLVAVAACTAQAVVIAAELRGVVVGISDGDTITVLDASHMQHKVRLAGIDAPERKQPFGRRSREQLSNLAFRNVAMLDCFKTDQYRRQVCRVWVEVIDVALAQVRAGFAWHYKRFEKEQTPSERAAYAQAEGYARAARTGLWRDRRPIPPWEFRRRK